MSESDKQEFWSAQPGASAGNGASQAGGFAPPVPTPVAAARPSLTRIPGERRGGPYARLSWYQQRNVSPGPATSAEVVSSSGLPAAGWATPPPVSAWGQPAAPAEPAPWSVEPASNQAQSAPSAAGASLGAVTEIIEQQSLDWTATAKSLNAPKLSTELPVRGRFDTTNSRTSGADIKAVQMPAPAPQDAWSMVVNLPPKTVEMPVVEPPVAEIPVAEMPVAEPPVAAMPVVEAPAPAAPAIEPTPAAGPLDSGTHPLPKLKQFGGGAKPLPPVEKKVGSKPSAAFKPLPMSSKPVIVENAPKTSEMAIPATPAPQPKNSAGPVASAEVPAMAPPPPPPLPPPPPPPAPEPPPAPPPQAAPPTAEPSRMSQPRNSLEFLSMAKELIAKPRLMDGRQSPTDSQEISSEITADIGGDTVEVPHLNLPQDRDDADKSEDRRNKPRPSVNLHLPGSAYNSSQDLPAKPWLSSGHEVPPDFIDDSKTQIDLPTLGDEVAAHPSLRESTDYVVKVGDTVESVAQDVLHDRHLAALLFSLNRKYVLPEEEYGVHPLMEGVVIKLPTADAVSLFKSKQTRQ
ncbi:MAG: hypothetical protein JST01_04910 [Cyanobacteria bacterium SZAS TMP-1]|nr:hypothetical protein [Cyanobacteria bacterium SZAS TMP-1]